MPPRKGDCVMTKLRQIVKDAFKCDELVYQFEIADVEDGLLDGVDVKSEVNAKYSDDHIIDDAENRLDIVHDNIRDTINDPQVLRGYKREARQLEQFLNKYRVA